MLVEPLPPARVAAIVDEIATRGFCTVDDVIPLESLDLLAPMMLGQAGQLEARRAWELRAVRPRHGSRGEGIHGGNHRHLQQAPPRHAPWVTAGWWAAVPLCLLPCRGPGTS